MKLHPPSWHLKANCPCCGQGSLEFSTCPTCGLVVLICSEIGAVFSISGRQCGPRIEGSVSDEKTCGNCLKSTYLEFRSLTSDEIRALGFRWPEDYD